MSDNQSFDEVYRGVVRLIEAPHDPRIEQAIRNMSLRNDPCECDDCDCDCIEADVASHLCWSCQRGDHEPHPLLSGMMTGPRR